MITIYETNETDFTHNGITTLKDATECKIDREINQLWEANLTYPIGGKNYNEIKINRVIKTITPSGYQLFRIRSIERTLTDVEAYATHIFFDLATNYIRSCSITGKIRKEAITLLLANTLTSNSFKYVDKYNDNSITQELYTFQNDNHVNGIFNKDNANSILSLYGGEIDIDNFNISSAEEIGRNTNILIQYNKNLTGIDETLDISNIITRCIPVARNKDGSNLYLPEYCIDSPYIGNFYQPFYGTVDMQDIQVSDDLTESQAYTKMRAAVAKLYSDNEIDIPYYNYKITFEDLANTKEYEQFKELYRINVGDTILVRHKDLGIDLNTRVIKYEYDSIKNKLISVELGQRTKDLSLTINNIAASIKFTEQDILLKVSNLDDTLSSEIELTATQIRSEVDDKTSQLSSTITQTASEIRSEVTDGDNQLNSKIDQTASSITTTINNTKDNLQSQITQNADSIKSCVTKDKFGSYITQNVDSIVEAIQDTTGSHTCTFNSSGLIVQNGGLIVKDNSGNTIMQFKDGVAVVKDLDMRNGTANQKGSAFYNTLSNMEEVSTPNLKASETFSCHISDDDDFYINGFGGNLKEYIEHVVNNM
ncbi:phage tail spike protein [Clostridium sp. BL-8]|uniref:phage tail spike protein n=1 Tax=Clostridium sp. BL-8 TaxID=349938 RepID=UPI0009C5A019|nr:phage tail spike protein [Clostridium sp. BL-8]OOM76572.1 prophage endopeptidase tail [Clostridium sp. BL-8]